MTSDIMSKIERERGYVGLISKAGLKRLKSSGYCVVKTEFLQELQVECDMANNEINEQGKLLDRANVAIVQSVARIAELQSTVSELKQQLLAYQHPEVVVTESNSDGAF